MPLQIAAETTITNNNNNYRSVPHRLQSEYNTLEQSANQNPFPFPISPSNQSHAPLQLSSYQPKRGFFKKELDLQQLINGHSNTIEVLNQRELMLQDREKALLEKLRQHDDTVQKWREKLAKLHAEEQKLKIRKQTQEEEWKRVDQLRQQTELRLEQMAQREQELAEREAEINDMYEQTQSFRA